VLNYLATHLTRDHKLISHTQIHNTRKYKPNHAKTSEMQWPGRGRKAKPRNRSKAECVRKLQTGNYGRDEGSSTPTSLLEQMLSFYQTQPRSRDLDRSSLSLHSLLSSPLHSLLSSPLSPLHRPIFSLFSLCVCFCRCLCL